MQRRETGSSVFLFQPTMRGDHDIGVLSVRGLPPQPVLGPRAQPRQGEDLVSLQDDCVLPGGRLLLVTPASSVRSAHAARSIQPLFDVHEVAASDALGNRKRMVIK